MFFFCQGYSFVSPAILQNSHKTDKELIERPNVNDVVRYRLKVCFNKIL